MKSKFAEFTETNGVLIITILHVTQVSKLVIHFFLSALLLTFIMLAFSGKVSASTTTLVMLTLISIAALVFSLREIIWQFYGKVVIEINDQFFILRKQSPVHKTSVAHKTAEIKSFDNELISTPKGPLMLLHLLSNAQTSASIKNYKYGTLTSIVGLDTLEIIEIIELIRNKIKNRSVKLEHQFNIYQSSLT